MISATCQCGCRKHDTGHEIDDDRAMNDVTEYALAKVPAVTLGFWAVKILATTLGETGGDTVTMTLNWGYAAGVALFGLTLLALVVLQISARRFHATLYWATIVASTTFGTTLAATPITLTPREYGLLAFFMRNEDKVLAKSEILRNVWDAYYDGPDNVVEVYVGYLRRKIDVPFGTSSIETIRGVGYRLHA